MKKNIHVSAPGKLILLGEHVVVYGKPAIIASVAKRCHITITPREDTQIEIVSKNLNTSIQTTEAEIITQTKNAQKQWEVFAKTNDVALLKSITANPLDYSTIITGETLLCYKDSVNLGFTLTIDSEIPIGCGMGSSAALAVSIATAVSLFLEHPTDKEVINAIAFAAEQKKNGFPSGGDNSTCFYGELVWYRKETPDFKVIQPIPFTLSQTVAKNFMTIFTGIPNESTGEMVSSVRTLYQANQKSMNAIFDDQERLTRDLLSAMKDEKHEAIINIIRTGEKNLEKIGVVSPYVKAIIKKIEKAGGAAKICGGGGKAKGTGTVLLYHTNKNILGKMLKKEKLDFSEVTLGDVGVREEKNYE
jgi:mevalonate kinase